MKVLFLKTRKKYFNGTTFGLLLDCSQWDKDTDMSTVISPMSCQLVVIYMKVL